VSFIELRVQEIAQKYTHLVYDVLVLNLTDETFRLLMALKDGTTLRVSERWRGQLQVRYSYYWLDRASCLKIGWDNSPHHEQLENFPHHKHIGVQGLRVPSYETSLDAVMLVIEQELASSRRE
jgi:hypothetical protein